MRLSEVQALLDKLWHEAEALLREGRLALTRCRTGTPALTRARARALTP